MSSATATRALPPSLPRNSGDGTILTGFVTEKSDAAVTLATQQSVERVPRSEVTRLAPQARSLMPAQLLNSLADQELSDLLAYLDHLGQPLGDQ